MATISGELEGRWRSLTTPMRDVVAWRRFKMRGVASKEENKKRTEMGRRRREGERVDEEEK
ncbi:hypothetical protein CCACVL1_30567 [Corchorus capsularis]|uniref:Uncharacterized protein n=1 Tax=Corchorus capsularis TaxID=210143 RepID=A0A1R3FWH9_COCAP|nr:hypothetical protein CCACVL1_30567 [Corchorus capsularis]